MKKKFISILAFVLCLCNLQSKALLIMQCVNGQAIIYDLALQPNGQYSMSSWQYAGGCGGGNWAIQLDLILPTGNPVSAELSNEDYASLTEINTGAEPSLEQVENLISNLNLNPATKKWVNPLKLSDIAFNYIYRGQTRLSIFNAFTSTETSSGMSIMNLYSDANRLISISYKDINMRIIATETISVARGSNIIPLIKASDLSKGFYTLTICNDQTSINLSLFINH